MAEPVDTHDIAVTGDPRRARDTVVAALGARSFSLEWADEWTATATRGSRTKQLFLGPFAQHFEVGVTVYAAEGGSVVRLTRPSSGLSGGLAGRVRATNQFASLATELRQIFATNNVLRW